MQFSPDIINRLQQITTYQTQNIKVIEMLNSALFERALIENSYAASLDQLAKMLDITEDGLINDDVVDIVQAYRSVVLCEKEQAEYLKESIKNDILIILKELLNKQSESLQGIENNCKTLDKQLKANLNNLHRRANRYRQSLIDLPFAKSEPIKQSLEQEKNQNSIFLTQAINDYNKTIAEYFEGCVCQEETFKSMDKERRVKFNDVQMKLQVFHISTIKNTEYALKKMNTKIENQEIGKVIFSFKTEDQTRPVLNKFNVNDYLLQIESEISKQQPSLNLKTMQATAEIKTFWQSLKKTINRETTYDEIFNQLTQSNFTVQETLFPKIAGSSEELDHFLDSLRESKLPIEARTKLIHLNIYMQNLHKLLVDLIQYHYARNLTEQTIKLVKSTLLKYETLPVTEELKGQMVLYHDNVLKQPCLQDIDFCRRHFTVKIHEQQLIDPQKEVKRSEVIAELKFQSSKLLSHNISSTVIKQALKKLELDQKELEQVLSHVDMKINEKLT